MKRKLQLKKETLRTLSAEHLQQVAGGTMSDWCDAPMVAGGGPVTTRPRTMDVQQPIAIP
jgi:hypothetical protein